MNFKNLLLLSLITLSSQSFGMDRIKNYFQEARYVLTPASGNPLTWFGNNFHAVQDTLCYRSKTMSQSDLEQFIKKYHIKTILNLREETGTWFAKEKQVADRMGVELHTITLDSKKLPSQQQLKDILALFNNAPKPILFHCQAGVDRTSLIAAFWKLMMQNAPLEQALEQMTPSYGHFEWSRPLMRKCIELLDATRDHEGKIDLERYHPNDAMKTISLRPLPMRAAKSFLTIIKNNPQRSAVVTGVAAAIAVFSFHFFSK